LVSGSGSEIGVESSFGYFNVPLTKDVTFRGAKGIEWGTILAGQGCFRQHNEPGQDLCTQVMAKQTATLSVALGLYTWRKTLSTKHTCAR